MFLKVNAISNDNYWFSAKSILYGNPRTLREFHEQLWSLAFVLTSTSNKNTKIKMETWTPIKCTWKILEKFRKIDCEGCELYYDQMTRWIFQWFFGCISDVISEQICGGHLWISLPSNNLTGSTGFEDVDC